uniref:Uncharacterized protein n=1 Tax=viral metagenome TaxID=1070528 RepID=A0A6C0AW70_9ZZZZ|tara:strand:- start:21772 stop:22452 length:681 start_codon:yes stop_codon:yes gene_type:complete
MDEIIGCFFEKRKDLIHNTKQIADRDAAHTKRELEEVNKNITIIISYLYNLKYERNASMTIIDNINKSISKASMCAANAYCIYNSPIRNIVDMNLVSIETPNPSTIKIKTKDCNTIFTDENRDYTSIVKDDKIQININENTILTMPKDHVQMPGDSIQIQYMTIYYYRDISGKLAFYKYNGLDRNKLDLLKALIKKEHTLENINNAIQIAKEMYIEIPNVFANSTS